MKRLLLLSAFLLCGCDDEMPPSGTTPASESRFTKSENYGRFGAGSGTFVITDTERDCEYLVVITSDRIAITPMTKPEAKEPQ